MYKFRFISMVIGICIFFVALFTKATIEIGKFPDPLIITNIQIHYPDQTRTASAGCHVYVSFHMTKTGTIDSVVIKQASSSDSVFQEETIKMIKRIKFNFVDSSGLHEALWVSRAIEFQRDTSSSSLKKRASDSTSVNVVTASKHLIDLPYGNPFITIEPIYQTIEDSLSIETNPVDKLPEAIFCPPPVYPENAYRSGVRGSVVLSLLVDKDGGVKHVKVLKATPKSLGLEEASVNAMMSWKFKPALKNSKPVSHWVTQIVVFQWEYWLKR